MVSELNIGIAFVAGLISFFAPCVIVLVPAFLSHLAGSSLKDLESGDALRPVSPELQRGEQAQDDNKLVKHTRREILLNTVFFIIGFTIIFVLLGASLGFLSQFILGAQVWLQRIGGALIILFGLITLNLIKIPWLQREHRITENIKITENKKTWTAKYINSLVVGSAFAIGWTPCVGPVLAGVLVLAGTGGSVGAGVILLLAYSVGLMIPFFATALFTVGVSKFLSRHNTFLKWVNYAAGTLLILLGILVFTNNFARLVGTLYFLNI